MIEQLVRYTIFLKLSKSSNYTKILVRRISFVLSLVYKKKSFKFIKFFLKNENLWFQNIIIRKNKIPRYIYPLFAVTFTALSEM